MLEQMIQGYRRTELQCTAYTVYTTACYHIISSLLSRVVKITHTEPNICSGLTMDTNTKF